MLAVHKVICFNIGDVVNFEAQTTNETNGKMDWKGTVKGNEIEGTVSTLENGESTKSWFKGEIKKKEAA